MSILTIALVSRILANPVANVCQKKLVESTSSLVVNFYTSLILSIGCIVPALGINWTSYSVEFWLYVFCAGLFCSMGTICLIKALNYGELSILGPLNSYKSVVGLISAFLLLGEFPSRLAMVGVGLIIVGSFYLISPKKSNNYGKKIWLSVGLRMLALVFTGCEAAVLKQIIILSSPKVSFILWCFSALFFATLFIPLLKRRFVPIEKANFRLYLLMAGCLAIMQFSTNIVFSKMEVGTALALFQLSAIVNLFLGYKIFREGGMLRKFVGTTVMIIGAVTILLN